MRKSDLALDRYGVTQSSYFRLATAVELGMGIVHGNIPFCNVISEKNMDTEILMRDYNNRTVYDCFNNNLQFMLLPQL